LNVFDVLNYDELLMTESTARTLEARLAGKGVQGGLPGAAA
jgi:hypothetical protein